VSVLERDELIVRLVEDIADNLGRWNRQVVCEDRYVRDLLERFASRLEILWLIVVPTAAERCAAYRQFGLDEDDAAALGLGDAEQAIRRLRNRMRLDPDGAQRKIEPATEAAA
jgi:hypothetical protein